MDPSQPNSTPSAPRELPSEELPALASFSGMERLAELDRAEGFSYKEARIARVAQKLAQLTRENESREEQLGLDSAKLLGELRAGVEGLDRFIKVKEILREGVEFIDRGLAAKRIYSGVQVVLSVIDRSNQTLEISGRGHITEYPPYISARQAHLDQSRREIAQHIDACLADLLPPFGSLVDGLKRLSQAVSQYRESTGLSPNNLVEIEESSSSIVEAWSRLGLAGSVSISETKALKEFQRRCVDVSLRLKESSESAIRDLTELSSGEREISARDAFRELGTLGILALEQRIRESARSKASDFSPLQVLLLKVASGNFATSDGRTTVRDIVHQIEEYPAPEIAKAVRYLRAEGVVPRKALTEFDKFLTESPERKAEAKAHTEERLERALLEEEISKKYTKYTLEQRGVVLESCSFTRYCEIRDSIQRTLWSEGQTDTLIGASYQLLLSDPNSTQFQAYLKGLPGAIRLGEETAQSIARADLNLFEIDASSTTFEAAPEWYTSPQSIERLIRECQTRKELVSILEGLREKKMNPELTLGLIGCGWLWGGQHHDWLQEIVVRKNFSRQLDRSNRRSADISGVFQKLSAAGVTESAGKGVRLIDEPPPFFRTLIRFAQSIEFRELIKSKKQNVK